MADVSSGLSEFQNDWQIVFASTIGIALGLAPLGTTYTLGPLAGAIEQQFGWTRTEIMTATIYATGGLLPSSMLVGWLCDRVGVRRVVMASQLGLGLCFVALSVLTTSLATFYAIYFLMGLLAAGSLPIPFSKAITSRFEAARGLALGLGLAGTGLCGFAAPSFTTWLVGAYGWRGAYLGLAALPVLIALPVVALCLKEPLEQRSDTRDRADRSTLAEALMTWRFWLLASCFFPVSLSVTGMITNLVPLLKDHGLTPVLAAGYAGLVGVGVIAGRVIVGFLVDRFWAPAVGFVFIAAPALACFILQGSGVQPVSLIFAIALLGLATGAEIDLNAYLVSRYFGRRAYGRVYSAQYVLLVIGAGIASPLFGHVHDLTGSYAVALQGAAAAFTVGAFGLLFLGKYPSRDTIDRPI